MVTYCDYQSFITWHFQFEKITFEAFILIYYNLQGFQYKTHGLLDAGYPSDWTSVTKDIDLIGCSTWKSHWRNSENYGFCKVKRISSLIVIEI